MESHIYPTNELREIIITMFLWIVANGYNIFKLHILSYIALRPLTSNKRSFNKEEQCLIDLILTIDTIGQKIFFS